MDVDPVDSFRLTKSDNKKYFGKTMDQRANIDSFYNTNYITNYKPAVGVAKPMNPVFTDAWNRSSIESILTSEQHSRR